MTGNRCDHKIKINTLVQKVHATSRAEPDGCPPDLDACTYWQEPDDCPPDLDACTYWEEPDGCPPALPRQHKVEYVMVKLSDGSTKRLIKRNFRMHAREYY